MLISADGRSGAWTYPASRRRLEDRRKRRRATLVEILLAHGNRHIRMAHVELLVEVREFPPSILQEEAADVGERSAKQVHREHHEEYEIRGSIAVVQDRFGTDHELQRVGRTKSI